MTTFYLPDPWEPPVYYGARAPAFDYFPSPALLYSAGEIMVDVAITLRFANDLAWPHKVAQLERRTETTEPYELNGTVCTTTRDVVVDELGAMFAQRHQMRWTDDEGMHSATVVIL